MKATKIVMITAAVILVLMMLIGGGISMTELWITDLCFAVLIVGTCVLLVLSNRKSPNGRNDDA